MIKKNLTSNEGKILTALSHQDSTVSELSIATKIQASNLYRIAPLMIDKSLISIAELAIPERGGKATVTYSISKAGKEALESGFYFDVSSEQLDLMEHFAEAFLTYLKERLEPILDDLVEFNNSVAIFNTLITKATKVLETEVKVSPVVPKVEPEVEVNADGFPKAILNNFLNCTAPDPEHDPPLSVLKSENGKKLIAYLQTKPKPFIERWYKARLKDDLDLPHLLMLRQAFDALTQERE